MAAASASAERGIEHPARLRAQDRLQRLVVDPAVPLDRDLVDDRVLLHPDQQRAALRDHLDVLEESAPKEVLQAPGSPAPRPRACRAGCRRSTGSSPARCAGSPRSGPGRSGSSGRAPAGPRRGAPPGAARGRRQDHGHGPNRPRRAARARPARIAHRVPRPCPNSGPRGPSRPGYRLRGMLSKRGGAHPQWKDGAPACCARKDPIAAPSASEGRHRSARRHAVRVEPP